MFSSSGDAAVASRFLAAGAFNTAFGFAMILFFMAVGFGAVIANVCGYASGLLLSFAVNRRFVFRGTGAVSRELLRYVAAFLLSFAANLVVLYVLTRDMQVDQLIAQFFAICAYVILMFSLCRVFVFRNANDARRPAE